MYDTTMFANGYGYPYAGAMPVNMTYPQVPAKANMTQALTPEEEKILSDKGAGSFTTKVTNEDIFKSYCTHKKDGKVATIQQSDGSFLCTVCGEVFNLVDLDKDVVEEKVKDVIDIMQSIKLAYLDIPVEMVREYFPIIPLIKKLPKLATIATSNFAHYEPSNSVINGSNYMNGFASYNNILGGGAIPYTAQVPLWQQQAMSMQQQAMAQMYPQQSQNQVMMQPGYTANPNVMATPMNPTGGYPVYQQQAPQAAMMMPQPAMGQQQIINEFGTYGTNTPYVPQPQPQPTQQPVAQNPTIPTPQQTPQQNQKSVIAPGGPVPPTATGTAPLEVNTNSFTV